MSTDNARRLDWGELMLLLIHSKFRDYELDGLADLPVLETGKNFPVAQTCIVWWDGKDSKSFSVVWYINLLLKIFSAYINTLLLCHCSGRALAVN